MFVNREIKIYSIICAAFIVLINIILWISTHEISTMLILTSAMLVIFLTGFFVMAYIYRRINGVRNELENMNINMADKYSEGEIGKLAMSMTDMLTRLKEAENKQRAEKEFLRDIISDISHQIKTPVASLTVFNDILLKEIQDENLNVMVEQSELQLERIKWLVSSMLQLARIEAESVTFNREKVGARTLIDSCIDIVRFKASEKGIGFDIVGEDATINVDEEWFKEALINIIKNAVDYSPEDSKVTISINSTPIAVKISVLDRGIGIAEEERLNIFKRFYRVNGSGANPNSVGIGLALSKSIIEGCGGRIWVESRHMSECIGGEDSYTNMVIML